MGDCYSVELKVKLRKSTKSNMQKLMREWMKEQECRKNVILDSDSPTPGVNWSLSVYRKAGIRPDSFVGICKILLAFHQKDCHHIVDKDGFDVFASGFNASYGWYSVMVEAFGKMAWALESGSRLEIYSDGGHSIYEVEIGEDGDGEVWEYHQKQ